MGETHRVVVRRVSVALFGLLVLLSPGASAAGSAASEGSRGWPPERARQLPGYEYLFPISNASAPPRIRSTHYVLGELAARFRLDLSDDEVLRIARAAGAARVDRFNPLGLFRVRTPPAEVAMNRVMEELWASGAVVAVQENALGEPTSNDPLHANGSQWYVDHIRLPQAWALLPPSPAPRVVAVLDTGIHVGHPEFAGRLFVNPLETLDEIDNDGDGWIDDINGAFTFCTVGGVTCTGNIQFQNGSNNKGQHGTYTSSILMANTSNTFQGYGADRKVQLLTIRVATFGGVQLLGLTNGFDYLTLHPDFARIANISIAGLDTSNDEGTCAAPPPNGVLFSSICAAAESTILIGGAGNGGSDSGADDGLPESHPRVITVAGTDVFDQRATFSDGGISVDFSAPAVGIFTSDIAGVDPFRSNVDDDPAFANGTSWSAPMVAGIAALGLAVRPQMTRLDLYTALRETAVDLGAPGWDPFFGWGRVDAFGAVLMLKEQLLFVDDFETGDTSRWQ